DNAMKVFGRECSIGLEPDAKGAAPHVLVLTKLDVAALTKDLVAGGKDLEALWDEMQKRTGKCDFVVAPEKYRDLTIAVAARGDAKYHAALLGDTLAVATDGKLLRSAIDCRLDGGARSLAKKPGFPEELAKLPAGATELE